MFKITVWNRNKTIQNFCVLYHCFPFCISYKTIQKAPETFVFHTKIYKRLSRVLYLIQKIQKQKWNTKLFCIPNYSQIPLTEHKKGHGRSLRLLGGNQNRLGTSILTLFCSFLTEIQSCSENLENLVPIQYKNIQYNKDTKQYRSSWGLLYSMYTNQYKSQKVIQFQTVLYELYIVDMEFFCAALHISQR